MDSNLLTPLIQQLDKLGDTPSVALARVLEFSNKASAMLESLDSKLKEVEKQTIKTNGRVSALEIGVEAIEEKQTDDYEKLHSPLVVPIAELQKDVGIIKGELEFRKKIMIAAVSVLGTLFAVFGATWWEKIWFFANFNQEYLKTLITSIVHTTNG